MCEQQSKSQSNIEIRALTDITKTCTMRLRIESRVGVRRKYQLVISEIIQTNHIHTLCEHVSSVELIVCRGYQLSEKYMRFTTCKVNKIKICF